MIFILFIENGSEAHATVVLLVAVRPSVADSVPLTVALVVAVMASVAGAVLARRRCEMFNCRAED